MKHKIINNFLPKDIFADFKNLLMSNTLAWYWLPHMTEGGKKDNYFFNHCFFSKNKVQSSFYDPYIIPILKLLNCKAVIEIRANLMLKKEQQYFSEYHIDNNFKCNTAIFYINNCNGYTLLDEDKKIKINCEENKILVFNSNISHCAASQTDEDRRIVVNMNYF
jgi:hypothetical protein